MKKKEVAAVDMAAMKEAVENGEMTINQVRKQMGLSSIDSPGADRLMEIIKTCPANCDFVPVDSDDRFCGKCGSELQ